MPEQIPQQPNLPKNLEKKQEVDLHSLLTYENPKLAEYQEIIRKEHKSAPGKLNPAAFSEGWLPVYYNGFATGEKRFQPGGHEKVLPYLSNKLVGEFLIDIGGGFDNYMAELAKISGVKTYINVEVNLNEKGDGMGNKVPIGKEFDPYTGYPDSAGTQFEHLSDENMHRSMEQINVKADMLNFVARLPDNSCNFAINGIDYEIAQTPEYRKALMEELVRATRIGGVLFGIGSDIWKNDSRLKLMGIELEFDDPDNPHYQNMIFEKVK